MSLNAATAEDRLRELRDLAGQLTRERVRAEHARDAAQAQADRARRALGEEFGVLTVADAKAMLEDLTAAFDREVDALQTALDSLGA